MRYINISDIKLDLGWNHGRRPTEALLEEAKRAVDDVLAKHVHEGKLPRLTRGWLYSKWQEGLRIHVRQQV